MKALVIEDEILASRHLNRILNEAKIEVITTLDTIVSVIDWFKNNRQPDQVVYCSHYGNPRNHPDEDIDER